MKKSSLLFLGFGILLSGCYAPIEDRNAMVMQRATYDLECPAEKITLTELPAGVTGAKGCDKKENYQVWVNGFGAIWVNKEGAAAPVVPTPPVIIQNNAPTSVYSPGYRGYGSTVR